MRFEYKTILSLLTAFATAHVALAQPMPTERLDAVCLGRVLSYESADRVAHDVRGTKQDKPLKCLILDVEVKGYLLGTGKERIRVLVNSREPSEVEMVAPPQRAARLECLLTKTYRFSLQHRNVTGGFYLSQKDRFYADLSWSPLLPVYSVQGESEDFAAGNLDIEPFPCSVQSVSTEAYDRSLPQGLRLLDHIASEALLDGKVRLERIQHLHYYYDAPTESNMPKPKTLLDSIPWETRRAWFLNRFKDENLTPAQKGNMWLLSIRADWGDEVALQRVNKLALTSDVHHVMLPRKTDPQVLRTLIRRAKDRIDVTCWFALLSNPKDLANERETLNLALELLGKDAEADVSLLYTLQRMVKDESITPYSRTGIKTDLQGPIDSAKRLIKHRVSEINFAMKQAKS